MNIIPKPQKITFSGKYVPHGSVTESVDADMGKEEYSLNINRDGVFLKGGSERALHYADITYKQILREDGNMLPECEISDKPVFSRQELPSLQRKMRLPLPHQKMMVVFLLPKCRMELG